MLFGGKIVYGAGHFTVDCVIRNLTKRGAKLGATGAGDLPDQFHLLDVRAGVAYEATVKWRRPSEVGVTFGKSWFMNEDVPPQLHLVKRLWTDSVSR